MTTYSQIDWNTFDPRDDSWPLPQTKKEFVDLLSHGCLNLPLLEELLGLKATDDPVTQAANFRASAKVHAARSFHGLFSMDKSSLLWSRVNSITIMSVVKLNPRLTKTGLCRHLDFALGNG